MLCVSGGDVRTYSKLTYSVQVRLRARACGIDVVASSSHSLTSKSMSVTSNDFAAYLDVKRLPDVADELRSLLSNW